ncbi:maleylpyruvate isomerase family mycothiol-dependent enzyme [Streptomyces physcomitrii]|uniref:Maleylpyruvate isomerase family mycothiol-dependent enzyme n=1 Tax=Streptomyces physcomitrii TaxID=2724184 RepID=A0ABX1GXP6_9ACTN|nr:maleylpyruvate isomerase family mycothiol-dependent enzyme [Streptomyces physcomitrii]NKI40871.1 maleylpyruvate isomerase family mycothiol-dependent enzyme [Streptomyces physcomitrii]
MPPRKRLRSYDSAKIRSAVLGQYAQVREAVAGLSEEQLDAPTHLDGWAVRDLAAHVSIAVRAVSAAIDLPEPPKAELALLDAPFVTASLAEAVAEGSRALAAAERDLASFGAKVAAKLAEDLAATPDDRRLTTRLGTIELLPFLVTRTVELTVHTDDLNRATGLDIPVDREALAACTRMLADALAVKAPGGSTEVRVPPFAVVQCVEGPRHTRGTPPNVVETDPLTWVRLATGRTTWAEAHSAAKISASGERSDLSALLPLMS